MIGNAIDSKSIGSHFYPFVATKMSQNLDDCSPVSDSNKMDISSEPTTISQASPPTISSPESETKRNDTQESDHSYAHDIAATIEKCSNNDSAIDNGNSFDEKTVSNQFGGLTLVDTHPLMPRLSIDDNDASEDSPFTGSFNFPDVVPQHQLKKIEKLNTNEPTEILMNGADDDGQLRYRKGATLRPDNEYLGSSDSEPDISQYQASVEPSFQSVSLTNNVSGEKSSILPKPRSMRKIALTPELMSAEDVSSVETISNNSFDDDFDDTTDAGFDENVTGARRLKSNKGSQLRSGGGRDNNTGFNEINNEHDDDNGLDDSGAVNRDVVTLSDGQTRDIDMKVIEPYKRVLSHGGYLKAGGHNAIVIFAGCYLPDRSRTDYNYVMENLFLYVIKTLEQLVTEDYMLIYLHGGSSRSTVPPFPWLKKCYQLLDRRIRKSLKNLYIVHPTFWLKSIVWMTRPFISSKFWRKLVYIRTLEELYQHIPVEKAAVPEKVKRYDMKHV